MPEIIFAAGRGLHYRRWPGTGRPLVLLHGLLDSADGWAALAGDTHRPCFAFDLPGFGASPMPRAPRLASYADDVNAAIEALGIGGCTLVGHSLGGAVAAAVAERCPSVHSLVLLAPAGFGPIRLAEAFALPGVRHLAGACLPLALASPPVMAAAYMTFVSRRRLPTFELVERLRGSAWRAAPGATAAICALAHAGHAVDAFDRRRLAFDGPVAALWGAHDALVPASHMAGLRTALPQSRIETWRGMGHHPQRERPAELARFVELCATHARQPPARLRLAA
ncbi:MAG: alpha/beta fold hydrolase [Solirubrobacteraceae bacterium]